MDASSTRMEVFKTLVGSKKMMTLSEISKAMKIPQQKIAYHLPFLEDSGLIIREENVYYCQPIFIDENLLEICLQKITEVTEKIIESSIYFGEDVNKDDAETIVKNCIKTLFLMAMEEID
jgi:DNA-binding transcriptional ArsR family regulator